MVKLYATMLHVLFLSAFTMKYITIILLSLILLSSCANQTKRVTQTIAPSQAIEYSAASAPEAYKGVFEMDIKAGNFRERMIFLNSEKDYRDQRNLTIALRPRVVQELTNKFGKDPLKHLLNKRVVVKGEAKRMKIWMFYKTKKLNKYYYQTHVFVNSLDQISII